MSHETLHRLLRTMLETEKAWAQASSAGANHVQAACQSLQTLRDQAVYTRSGKPAAGETGRAHEAGVSAIRWLRTCVRRLGVALGGATRALEEIEGLKDGARWAEALRPVLLGLDHDLGIKKGVLDKILGCARGGGLDAGVFIAEWLEMAECVLGGAEVVVCGFEAEEAAGLLERDGGGEGRGEGMIEIGRRRKEESAVVMFLRKEMS